MKQQDITPKIIELAKAIAELWRMPIYVGCWMMVKGDDNWKITHKVDTGGFTLILFDSHWKLESGALYHTDLPNAYREFFLIPDIGDCERKLLRLGFTYRTDRLLSCVVIQLYDPEDEGKPYGKEMQGVNTHEALLSALLEVLKEQKSGVGEEKEGKSE